MEDEAVLNTNIPNGIRANLVDPYFNFDSGVHSDFVITDKDRGSLNHHSADFSSVGPDRNVICIDNIQYLHMTDIITSRGLPNYRLEFHLVLALIFRPGSTGYYSIQKTSYFNV